MRKLKDRGLSFKTNIIYPLLSERRSISLVLALVLRCTVKNIYSYIPKGFKKKDLYNNKPTTVSTTDRHAPFTPAARENEHPNTTGK